MGVAMSGTGGFEDRFIQLGPSLVSVPERLLLAHARGEVLFITGAGSSIPSGLPDFRRLVLEVYQNLDASTHAVLNAIPAGAHNQFKPATAGLTTEQVAEVTRFVWGDYDVVLGMIERRLDGPAAPSSSVRLAVIDALRNSGAKPAEIHKALVRLSDRGPATTVVTTNFDRLLETAAGYQKKRLRCHSLGAVPRPGKAQEFAGVLHIHGVLSKDSKEFSDFVVTDQDFGEFYLRRRVVPDFIYDAARLFHLVLVGYSANDAPMRYLLNAVAADGSRFSDLKERFAFVSTDGTPDPVVLEDWKGRGITPIPYDSSSGHQMLTDTLVRWAELSAINGKRDKIDSALKKIVRSTRATSSDADRDLFDHLIRRSGADERVRISGVISKAKATPDWLDALLDVERPQSGS